MSSRLILAKALNAGTLSGKELKLALDNKYIVQMAKELKAHEQKANDKELSKERKKRRVKNG